MFDTDTDVTALVEADHHRLRALISDLSAEAARPVPPEALPDWRRHFLRRLRDFQSQLLLHFDLEEDGGFFAGVLRVAPEKHHRIRQLEAEHPRIIHELDHLVGFVKNPARGIESLLPEIGVRFDRLVSMIQVHEAAENELIQQAYYQDYGVGD